MNVIRTYRDTEIMLHTTGASNESGRSFRVTWCNRWDLIDELVAAGWLRREQLGPATFGHCDYFYR
jgi:hypothetical protein